MLFFLKNKIKKSIGNGLQLCLSPQGHSVICGIIFQKLVQLNQNSKSKFVIGQ